MKIIIVALLILTSQSAFAYQQGDSYLGAQVGLLSLDVDDVDDIDIPIGVLRLGIYATRSLTFELRYGNDLEKDTVSGTDYAIDRIAGVYATYHYEFREATSVYGLLGYSEVDLKSKSGGVTDDEDLTSTSYGLGLNFNSINIELMQYLDRDDDRGSALNLGYSFYFD